MEGVHGDIHEIADIVARAVSRHKHTAIGVDGPLDHYIGNAEHTGLDACRNPDPGQIPKGPPVDEQEAPMVLPGSLFPGQAGEHQDGAEGLADHRGNTHAGYIPAQGDDRKQVQGQIRHAADGQEQQRPPGIPYGPQHRRAVVIQHDERRTQKINPQVQQGLAIHVGRRGHGPEDQRGCQKAHSAQEQTADQAQRYGCMQCQKNVPILMACPYVVGDQHIDGHGKADEQVRTQVDDGTRTAYGRQAAEAGELPHHDDIGRIEKHL